MEDTNTDKFNKMDKPTKATGRKFYPRSKPIRADAPNRQNFAQVSRGTNEYTEEDLKPKHLSTTFTTPKNDPADLDDFKVLGFEGFGTRQPKPRMKLDFSGYLDMVEETYDNLRVADKYLERTVTLSMFTYYCVTLLYQRIYTILDFQGEDYDDIRSDFDRSLGFVPNVPKPIAHFLNQIGTFTDVTRRTWFLNFHDLSDRRVQGLHGHYGRVTAATHHMYASQPSPFVAVCAILNDYVYSTNNAAQLVGYSRSWDLDAQLTPNANSGAQSPNSNLLCWRRSVRMRPEVVNILQAFNIHADWVPPQQGHNVGHLQNIAFGRSVGYYPMHSELLGFVSTKISTLSSVSGVNSSPVGSQCLIPYTHYSGNPEPGQRSSQSDCETLSSTQLTATRASGAAVTRLRAKRSNISSNYCFGFLNDEVPLTWQQTVNATFESDQSAWLNYEYFGLSRFRGNEASRAFTANVMLRK